MSEASSEIPILPFSIKPGEIISMGRETVTRELGPDYVIKTPHSGSVKIGRGSEEYLKQTRDDYLLLKKYVPDFVPETYFVRVSGRDGKPPTNCIIQRRLKNQRQLLEVSDDELHEPEIASQLLEYITGVMEMDEATGKIPDMFGRPAHPLNPRFYNPRYCKNISIAEDENGKKRIYLTDLGAITEHAEKKDPKHRISMRLIRRNLRRLREELENSE